MAILISSVDKTAVVPIKVGEMFRPKPAEPQPWETVSQTPNPTVPPAEPLAADPPSGLSETPSGFNDLFSSSNSLFGGARDKSPASTPGFGFMPPEEETPLFGVTSSNMNKKPEAEHEPEEKKKSGFWGRKLFGPNTSKFRGKE